MTIRILLAGCSLAYSIAHAQVGNLLPVGTHSTARENRGLEQVFKGFSKSPQPESAQRLIGDFLKRYPRSRWKASMVASLGSSYRATGRFTKALDSFEEAWGLTREGSSDNERTIANWALGELFAMHSHLGHAARIDELVAAAAERDIHGSTTEQLTGARESIWLKRHYPEQSARCGPLALASIAARLGMGEDARNIVLSALATADGMSLAALEIVAQKAGMKMIAAHREPGADILVPSVVHWKVDHYSAILERKVEGGGEFFLVENPLFEKQMWISRQALEEETSGYYLVLEGTLPSGWRRVTPEEGAQVWGRCGPNPDQQQVTMIADQVCCQTTEPGMAGYTFHSLLVSLHVTDEPLGYVPPVGPAVQFLAVYNQREAFQPAVFSYSNLGQKWTFGWMSYVTDRGDISGEVQLYLRGGGQETYQSENMTSIPGQLYTYYFNHDTYSHAQLVGNRTLTTLIDYQRLLPDGSKEIYSLVQNDVTTSSRRIFLTQLVDPAGNSVKLTYDARFRVVSVTDALGQVTTLSYELAGDPLKVTKVTDPFGRSALLTYNSNSQLASITDPMGITSRFTYGDGDFVNSLTTPYGTTTFAAGVPPGPDDPHKPLNRSLEATDPLGGTEHLEFHYSDSPVRANYYGVSLYWDKRAWALAPGDLNSARHMVWAQGTQTLGLRAFADTPNESEISYSYVLPNGLPTRDGSDFGIDFIGRPVKISRTLDDGSTQTLQLQYNSWGKPTRVTDPLNRVVSLVYDPTGIDLLEVHNVSDNNATIAKLAYNTQHLPITITDAAGQVTIYTYNPKGQVLSITDPKKQTTSFSYNAQEYLTAGTGPLAGATGAITYDRFGRTQSVTDSEGYASTYAYDALDRLTSVTHPDGTADQITYSNLDAVQFVDRLGRISQAAYDALRRPMTMTDPLGNVTTLSWCTCGSLDQVTDPNGNVTSFQRDLTGHLTSKTYADGSITSYSYGPMSGRLIGATDPNGQTTNYQYAADNNLLQMAFSNVQVPTAPVSFTYDPKYNRVASMQDGIGATTYSYNPPEMPGALQVAAVSGPWGNSSMTYSYDELGRVVGSTVDGAASGLIYDPLNRVTSETNPLGSFNATFVGATNRLSQLVYPNGQTTALNYYGNLGDQRLQQIQNMAGGQGMGSQFDYSYGVTGEMQSWAKQSPAATGAWQFTYDAAIQLTGVTSDGSGLSNYAYTYDAGYNRTGEQRDSFANGATFNNLNQIVSLQQGSTSNQLTYDANGNLLSDGTRTFEWDGLNRLTAVNVGTHRSVFSYDGLNRRAAITEIENGAVVADQQLTWCGDNICELHDSVSGITRRFYGEGESDDAGGSETPYYYTFDHLGSIRELSDSSGALVTAYDYDPFGRMSSTGGARDATFGYAGYFVHAPSGLYLTKYRAYDPNLGRWLSRDPIGEDGGVNLYGYAGSNPISSIDTLGLSPDAQGDIFESGTGGGVASTTPSCPCRKPASYWLTHIFEPGWNNFVQFMTTYHPGQTALVALPAAGAVWGGIAAPAAAINLTTDIPAAWIANVKPLPGFQDVFIHFSQARGRFGSSANGLFLLTAANVGARIASQPQYANMALRVFACRLGLNPAAAENLGAAVGQELFVANGKIYLYKNGQFFVGEPWANPYPEFWRSIPK